MSVERSWVEVSLGALRHNVGVVRSYVGSGRGIIGVVKANAYGHGAMAVARCLVGCGVKWLGVANVSEGVELRKGGIDVPILLLGAALPDEMSMGVEAGLCFTVSSFEEWEMLESVAMKMNRRVHVHVKFDTGMGRLGFFCDQAHEVARKVGDEGRWVCVDGYYSHFACAGEDRGMTIRQGEKFKGILRKLPMRRWHLANSAAVLEYPEFYGDWVRPGLMLYGVSPVEGCCETLKPALSWKSRVSLVRKMKVGMTISYGATYRLREDAWIAVVSVGYADGFFRSLSNCGDVLMKGVRCKVCGRVTMDEIMVDVTEVVRSEGGVSVGDEVTLIGSSGGERIDAAGVARKAGTIAWDVLTGIGQRVRRFYVD